MHTRGNSQENTWDSIQDCVLDSDEWYYWAEECHGLNIPLSELLKYLCTKDRFKREFSSSPEPRIEFEQIDDNNINDDIDLSEKLTGITKEFYSHLENIYSIKNEFPTGIGVKLEGGEIPLHDGKGTVLNCEQISYQLKKLKKLGLIDVYLYTEPLFGNEIYRGRYVVLKPFGGGMSKSIDYDKYLEQQELNSNVVPIN